MLTRNIQNAYTQCTQYLRNFAGCLGKMKTTQADICQASGQLQARITQQDAPLYGSHRHDRNTVKKT